jgi:4-diphosphocytidyl-2-C-methyl-D-erythritol kinase
MAIKTIKAHAKINLMLHVTGKLPDGYHSLQSVFAFTDLVDEITLTESPSTSVIYTGDFASDIRPGEDSITKALAWYFSYTGLSFCHYTVHVQKNIPTAAGLGGGTSDAAAVLAWLYDQDFTTSPLDHKWNFIKASGTLGADVPVSLAFHLGLGKVFWVEGSGREGSIKCLDTKNLSRQLVLVNPGVKLSTAAVFAKLNGRFDDKISAPLVLSDQFMQSTRNILQAAALPLCPDIPKIFMIFMLNERIP